MIVEFLCGVLKIKTQFLLKKGGLCHKAILKLILLLVVHCYFIVIYTGDIMVVDLCSLTVLHKVIVVYTPAFHAQLNKYFM